MWQDLTRINQAQRISNLFMGRKRARRRGEGDSLCWGSIRKSLLLHLWCMLQLVHVAPRIFKYSNCEICNSHLCVNPTRGDCLCHVSHFWLLLTNMSAGQTWPPPPGDSIEQRQRASSTLECQHRTGKAKSKRFFVFVFAFAFCLLAPYQTGESLH